MVVNEKKKSYFKIWDFRLLLNWIEAISFCLLLKLPLRKVEP